MAPPSSSDDASTDRLIARSIAVGDRSAQLIALSDAARARLTELTLSHASPVPEEAPGESPPTDAVADAALDQQMVRSHVFVVNSDPAFLDVARVLLQSQRYNVTSTNLVPQTYAMVHASGAQAMVIDLAAGESALWALVDQLVEDPATRALPVVMTALDMSLLDAAERRPWPTSGRFHLLKPLDPGLLTDVMHALIGPA
jgi:CheY-like chemotaxis protein